MALQIVKASKKQSRLRAALVGVSGSGKTFSGLQMLSILGTKIGVIDTERGSASKYSHKFPFDVVELDKFSPRNYVEAIKLFESNGYDALLIDSLSHAWSGTDGALEQVDNKAAQSNSKNTFTAWRDVTPMHNQMIDAILASRMHIIVTMRVHTEWAMQENERGKKEPVKIGLAPVQKKGVEYEFDIVGEIDTNHNIFIAKSRCEDVDGQVFRCDARPLAETLLAWVTEGAPMPVAPAQVLCHCQQPARYVRGKTAAGWTCANNSCEFKQKDESYVPPQQAAPVERSVDTHVPQHQQLNGGTLRGTNGQERPRPVQQQAPAQANGDIHRPVNGGAPTDGTTINTAVRQVAVNAANNHDPEGEATFEHDDTQDAPADELNSAEEDAAVAAEHDLGTNDDDADDVFDSVDVELQPHVREIQIAVAHKNLPAIETDNERFTQLVNRILKKKKLEAVESWTMLDPTGAQWVVQDIQHDRVNAEMYAQ